MVEIEDVIDKYHNPIGPWGVDRQSSFIVYTGIYFPLVTTDFIKTYFGQSLGDTIYTKRSSDSKQFFWYIDSPQGSSGPAQQQFNQINKKYYWIAIG